MLLVSPALLLALLLLHALISLAPLLEKPLLLWPLWLRLMPLFALLVIPHPRGWAHNLSDGEIDWVAWNYY